MSNTNTLVVQGKPLSLSNYGGAINEKGSLTSARLFVGFRFGLSVDDMDGAKLKDVKALIKKADPSITDAQIKVVEKEFDEQRSQFRKDSRSLTALLVADPNFRAQMRVNKNRKGEVIGATTTFRKERAQKATLANENAILKARIAALEAQVAG